MSEEIEKSVDQEAPAWLDYFVWQIPFAILLAALFISNLSQLPALLEQSKQLNAAKAQLDQEIPRAQMVRVKLDELARDLVELAKTDPNARQVQDDLRLQISDQPGSPQSPTAAPAPAATPAPAMAPGSATGP